MSRAGTSMSTAFSISEARSSTPLTWRGMVRSSVDRCLTSVRSRVCLMVPRRSPSRYMDMSCVMYVLVAATPISGPALV